MAAPAPLPDKMRSKMESDIIEGFRQMFVNEHRKPIVAIDYDRDVKPLLEETERVEYAAGSGASLPEAVAKAKRMKSLRDIIDIYVDIACAPGYDIPMADMSAVLDLVSDYPNRDNINVVYGVYRDDREKYNVSIRCVKRAILQYEGCPVMMYLHGFMSGSNGAKQQQLQRHFYNKFRVIAPELDADPESSLRIINEAIEEYHPAIIVGTSLGGFMALTCNSGDAQLVVVNPCLFPREQLAQWVDEEHTYFCKRVDGVQTYTLRQPTLDKYLNYDAVQAVRENQERVTALCSTTDDLLGDSHIRALQPMLPSERLHIVSDFGHQCNGKGLKHLFSILDRL
jgi:predicted esterase YcpF (UPF0227 family)